MKRTDINLRLRIPYPDSQFRMRSLTRWLPTPSNVIFTVLLVGGLLWAQNVGAFTLGAPLAAATSTGTIAYQGRLADAGGNPLTDTYNMVFRLYSGASGGAPLWEEQWTGSNSVAVSDGLFNVMLGSLTPIPQTVITGNSNLFLGISVGTDSEMSPRIQLGSIPYAVQALTVPDGSITTSKLASDVNLVPPDGSISNLKLADGAVTPSKLTLPNGKICLPANTTVNVPGNYSRIQIPNMSLSLTLDRPVQALIWSRGAYHFDASAHMGTAIFLNDTEIFSVSDYYGGTGWDSFATVDLVTLPAGEHTLDLRTSGQQAGTMSYGSGCLEYIVISGS